VDHVAAVEQQWHKNWSKTFLSPPSLLSNEEINLLDFLPLTKRQCVQYLPKETPEACQCICSHATCCTPCAKAKAAYKPFDVDKARAKAKAEMVWRSKAKKAKQQTDMEWKAEVSRKLEKLSELRGLKKNVCRITVVLEKLAGIEG